MTLAGAFGLDPARTRLARFACLILIVFGWGGLAVLCNGALAKNPPAAGFDLQLLLDAARRVADGGSPYDASAVAGGLTARDLFYSYPPLVAQVLAPLSGLAGWIVLGSWWIGAGVGLAAIAAALARPGLRLDTVLVTLAAAPLFLPFGVGLLFGNIDVWFPLLFGAVIVAACAAEWGVAPGPRALAAGAVALAVASAVKIHPATLLLWLVVLAFRRAGPRRALLLRVAAGAVAAGAVIFAASLLAGGLGPWQQYPEYLRLGSNADLASRVNIGPASQIALLLGDGSLARPLALVVAGLALAGTAAAAWLVRDPLASIAWAIAASLIVLPVTWYHYPVAFVPVAVALWVRTRGTRAGRGVTAALAIAYVVADVAVALPVALWVAVGILLVAVHWAVRKLAAEASAA